MTPKFALVASLLMAFAGVAQAQTSCTCDANATRTDNAAVLASLLSNKMVCGNVGGEVWQEWHNGATSGPVVDYKKGPGDAVDPSTTVGTYTVNTDNTVSYNYPGQPAYRYDVCLVASTNSYTFCGASYGGRNITGVRVGGAGLAACSSVSNLAVLSVKDKRTTVRNAPVSAPATRAP
jgi:hypothetical protein